MSLCCCPFDIPVGTRAFVIGLSQISSFFSFYGFHGILIKFLFLKHVKNDKFWENWSQHKDQVSGGISQRFLLACHTRGDHT